MRKRGSEICCHCESYPVMVFGIVRSLLVGRRGRSGTFFRFLEGFPLTAIDQKKEEELFGFRIQAIYPPFFPSPVDRPLFLGSASCHRSVDLHVLP